MNMTRVAGVERTPSDLRNHAGPRPRRGRILIFLGLLAAFAPGVEVLAGNITCVVKDPPLRGGEDEFVVIINGKEHVVKIKVVEGRTKEGKARDIRDAMNEFLPGVDKGTPKFRPRAVWDGNDRVTIEAIDKLIQTQNQSGEKDAYNTGGKDTPFSDNFKPTLGICYSGFGVGLADNGLPSRFEASLAFTSPQFGEVRASSILDAGEVGFHDRDTVLARTHESLMTQLPLELQSSLTLDLLHGEIAFTGPSDSTFASISAWTNDQTAQLLGKLETRVVPEPATIGLAGSALVVAMFRELRRRRSAVSA
ncbi:MAG: hypothetical protein SFX72_16915 [Isosphaeraceae bacterium]|nr:hypothetical protein [Isosphaeraceae bacterium]